MSSKASRSQCSVGMRVTVWFILFFFVSRLWPWLLCTVGDPDAQDTDPAESMPVWTWRFAEYIMQCSGKWTLGSASVAQRCRARDQRGHSGTQGTRGIPVHGRLLNRRSSGSLGEDLNFRYFHL